MAKKSSRRSKPTAELSPALEARLNNVLAQSENAIQEATAALQAVKVSHRRGFMFATGGLIAGAAGSAVVTWPINKSMDYFWDDDSKTGLDRLASLNSDLPPLTDADPVDREKAKIVRHLLSGKGRAVKIHGGKDHHAYEGRHPDDRWAVEVIARQSRNIAKSFHQVDDAVDINPDASLVLAGSPVSNYWTRAALGYAYIDEQKKLLGLTQVKEMPYRLPFEYLLDSSEIMRSETGGYKPSRDRKLAPNWGIKTRQGVFHPGEPNGPGDYLLVTRIPNILNGASPAKAEDTITIFGGTHGAATASVRHLFDDLDLLKRLDQKVGKLEFWQALIPVTRVEETYHDYRKRVAKVAVALDAHPIVEEVRIA